MLSTDKNENYLEQANAVAGLIEEEMEGFKKDVV